MEYSPPVTVIGEAASMPEMTTAFEPTAVETVTPV